MTLLPKLHIVERPNYLIKNYARDLYIPELQTLIDFGQPVDVRGRKTMELMNFMSIINEPKHHCILLPSRRWNPWIALSEFLWIMAGRDDIAGIKPYNSRISDYSDDGVRLYGAYGPRIHDQIDDVITRLHTDPSDRRAVINIWREQDLTAVTRDAPCLAGDTIVQSPEGDVEIRELVGKKYPVYSLNEKTKKIELAWANGISKGVRKTVSIQLDAGEAIRVTPDHKFLRKIRQRFGFETKHASSIQYEWIEASSLCSGDSVVPIHLQTEKGYRMLRNWDVTQNWSGANKRAEHRFYYEFLYGELPAGFDVHHKNENKLDNRAENLVLFRHDMHQIEHHSNPDGREYKEKEETKWKRTNPLKENEILELGRTFLAKHGKLVFHTFNKEYGCAGTVLSRWGKWSNFVSAVVGNHKVVSITEGKEEEVFDLQVEGNHNFFIAPGVLVHNCNDMLMFKLREGKLHMTVINRSNDIHWGLFAVNIPTFGLLLDYMAARLGVEIGTQTHISNSLHVYTDQPEPQRITERMLFSEPEDRPAYPKHSNAFYYEDTIISDKHQVFGDMASLALELHPTTNSPRFFEFAVAFLSCYKEREMSPELAQWPEYADWVLAGEIFAGKVWNARS